MVGVISQVENGCQAVADSLLVFVPHKTLERCRVKLGIQIDLEIPVLSRLSRLGSC